MSHTEERNAGRRRKPLWTDEQWKLIGPLLPEMPKSKKGGRPWAPNRGVLDGILWVLRTGARWQDLPDEYLSPSTCWRRLQRWEVEDVWLEIWRAFLGTLDERGQLDWSEAFIDGSFVPAKKGGLGLAQPSGGKAQSGWWWSTAKVFLWESTWRRRARRK
jgi:transposase